MSSVLKPLVSTLYHPFLTLNTTGFLEIQRRRSSHENLDGVVAGLPPMKKLHMTSLDSFLLA